METMTSPKPAKPAPSSPPAISAERAARIAKIKAEEGIPLEEIVFYGARPGGPDLPVLGYNGGVPRLRASKAVKMDYVPKFRGVRLIIATNRPGNAEAVIVVPESWCSWEV
jgi:hypothetical protein